MKRNIQAYSKVIAIILISVAIIGCAASPQSSNDEVKNTEVSKNVLLKMSHGQSDQTTLHKAASMFAEGVTKRTDGIVEVAVFANSSIASNVDGIEQAKLGVSTVQAVNPTQLTKWAPDLGILGGPFIQLNLHSRKIITRTTLKPL